MSVLNRGLNARHIGFLALGSAVGTGLFYGAAKAIQSAGPSVIFAYVIGGLAIYMVMRALGEMVLHNPTSGSFAQYASDNINPLAGFLTGWSYIFEMIIVCLADVTAFALYMGFWFPDTPQWIWVLGVIILIGGLNLFHVKIFGEMEFWLTLIKVLAIISMIVGGTVILLSGIQINDGTPPSFSNLWENGGFFPNGITGFLLSFVIVMYAYGGIEVVGISSAEANNPEKTIPKAINMIPFRILLFYVLTIIILLSIMPWTDVDGKNSPFVQIFSNLGFSSAATILNIIVISASISAINSDIFGAGRMIFGLAANNQAPKVFLKISRFGVPYVTVLSMSGILLLGVVLNYYIPEDVFLLIASLATFATVWVWLMILLSQYFMRKKLNTEETNKLQFKMPFYPFGSIITIAFMIFVICLLAIDETTRNALYVGLIWIGLLSIFFYKLNNKNNEKNNLG